MNYNRQQPQKTAGVIRYSCGILFMLFSFVYVYFQQGELLAQAQYVFSHGVTHYSLPVGAVVITLVLQILQWVVARVALLPSRWYALSYFPSVLALVVLTDLGPDRFQHYSLGVWAWLAPLLLVVFVLLVVVARRVENSFFSDISSQQTPSLLWPNYLILCLLIVFCGSQQSVPDVYFYELKAERLILEGKTKDACLVGEKSLENSVRLANLRAYALSLSGQLPEQLFMHSQPYGIRGLIDLADRDTLHERLTSLDICRSLGALPDSALCSLDRYIPLLLAFQQHRLDSLAGVDTLLLASNDSIRQQHGRTLRRVQQQIHRARDYQLCALLLQRRLDKFLELLPQYYELSDSDESVKTALPRAYREALAQADTLQADTATLTLRRRYVEMCDTLTDPRIRYNMTRHRFGTTYWWYFDNP